LLVMIYAVFATASRGGFLSLIVATAVCLWEFAVRGRRRYLLLVAVITGIVFWTYAAGGVKQRFNSTFDDNNEQENTAYGSAQERRELLTKSLNLTAQHPFFGIGPGNFAEVSGHWRETHNSYTQMSSEGGVLAFVFYVLILRRGFVNLRGVKRLVRGSRELNLMASGLRASLAGFVVGSFFASEAYQFFPYFLIAYTTTLYRVAARESIASNVRETVDLESQDLQPLDMALPSRGSA